jgi:hypothetical protein
MEQEQLYRIVVSQRSGQFLSTILDACGESSLMTMKEKSYVVRTTKAIAEKLKVDNDWVEKVELYLIYHVRSVVDE